jgi:hypothetical protein
LPPTPKGSPRCASFSKISARLGAIAKMNLRQAPGPKDQIHSAADSGNKFFQFIYTGTNLLFFAL